MMIYDYNNLLKAVREIKTSKIIAENERTASKKNKLAKLELDLKSSGLLDDWYDLKRTCKELGIRIMPYGGWDEEQQGPLMDDFEYFDDSGMFLERKGPSSDRHNMFGFSYKDMEFKWRTATLASPVSFHGYDNEDAEIDAKIRLIKLFMANYEEYRAIQLRRIYTKLGKEIEKIKKIKSEIV